MKLSLEFLGSGTSVGVPAIGCECPVCISSDPFNKRLRSSVLVRGYDDATHSETTVVIDTSPDFRQQMLRSKTKHIDALIITHYHADHVVGIDDVRRFNVLQNAVIDCWATPTTLDSLRQCFGYIFSFKSFKIGHPCLNARTITIGEPFQIGCLRFEPLELDHTLLMNVGFRITVGGGRALSYCLDVKSISPDSYEALRGTHTLVLDMLREKVHPTHFNLDEAMQAVKIIGPQRTYFGHIAHEVEHRSFEARLPPDIRLAYDGLIVELDS